MAATVVEAQTKPMRAATPGNETDPGPIGTGSEVK